MTARPTGAAPSRPGSSRPSTLGGLLATAAAANPDALALLAPGRPPLRYRELGELVDRTSRRLGELGVGTHSRVGLVMPPGPELAVLALAASSIAPTAPLNPALRAGEIGFACADLGLDTVVLPAGATGPALEAARTAELHLIEVAVDPGQPAGTAAVAAGYGSARPPAVTRTAAGDDVALLLHTSGTSSRPKAVPLRHRNLCAAAWAIRDALELGPHDRCLNVMPMFHIHGLSTLYATLAGGGSLVCPPGFLAPQFLEWVEQFSPTWYTAAPTIHRAVLARALEHPRVLERHPLRFVRSASAPMPPDLIVAMEQAMRAPFVEAYGMTEAAPQIASNRPCPGGTRLGSVGRAAGPEVAIMALDSAALLPAGTVGEIVVRGPNVIDGYENNPEADAAAFVDGWFRTGDEGRLDDAGFLHVTGRRSEVVNRGGEKIMPREVDEALLAHPDVVDAVAFPVPDARLGQDIAAAVVRRAGSAVDAVTLRRFVAGRLADFKVPTRVVFRDQLPTGATGKLRRSDVAVLLGLHTDTDTDPARSGGRPVTPTQRLVAATVADVLRCPEPDLDADFLDLGGDSILAAEVLARLWRQTGVRVPLVDFVASPTVRALAGALDSAPPETPEPGPVPGEAAGGRFMTSAQRGLWFLDRLDPGDASYNVFRVLRLRGALRPELLVQAWSRVVERHELLTTVYPDVGGRAAASPLARPNPMSVVEVTDTPTAEDRARAYVGQPFDLARGPLVRAQLVGAAEGPWFLALSAHHIVADGASVGIILGDLAASYADLLAGGGGELPPLPVTFSDYAAWRERTLDSAAGRAALQHWRQVLAGARPVDLPGDRPRPSRPSFAGGRVPAEVTPDAVRALRAVTRAAGATPFMGLVAVTAGVLARWSGTEDVTIGTPVHGRTWPATRDLVGYLATTVVLRVDSGGDPDLLTLLGRVREVAFAAYSHADVSFDRVVEAVAPARDPGRAPLFSVNLRLHSAPPRLPDLPGMALDLVPVDIGRAKFDLAVELAPCGGDGAADGLAGFVEFARDLFDETTAVTFGDALAATVTAWCAEPATRLSALDLDSIMSRRDPAPGRVPDVRAVRRRAVEASGS